VNARDFRCFFSAGSGWGVFRQRLEEKRGLDARLEVRHGELRVRHLSLRNESAWPAVAISSLAAPGVPPGNASVRVEGETLAIDLGQEALVGEGQALALTLRRAPGKA
jgi:hypothetical protein